MARVVFVLFWLCVMCCVLCVGAGVQKIMVTGTSLHASKEALRLTRLYPGTLYSTAGVHPHDAKSWTEESMSALRDLASTNVECVAIGECGLDYNRMFSPRDMQLHVFEQQVKLAVELNKPLFVHEREAHDDLVEVLTKFTGKLPPTVIHCFTGTVDEAREYIARGFYIGLTGAYAFTRNACSRSAYTRSACTRDACTRNESE